WGAYFVTFCTAEKRASLGRRERGRVVLSPAGEIARKCWLEIPGHFPSVKLGEFVVMPDHFHGIVMMSKAGAGHSGDGGRALQQALVGSRHAATPSAEPTVLKAPLSSSKSASQINPNSLKGLPFEGPILHQALPGSLGVILRSFKSAVTRLVNLQAGTPGKTFWQSGFHDSLIRNETQLLRITRYIQKNPSK
ncbi:MAG: hypothetical protein K8T20_05420, partial [Planctomycetes bacterium]|nr:hypothetical protein [Planctomycetota bacterium]